MNKVSLFGEDDDEMARNMSSYFGVPPFSVVDTTTREWMARKRKWDELIKDEGQTRKDALGLQTLKIKGIPQMKNQGISILDACLAEIMVKWFTEKDYTTFDPFAGDTIFGFVSAFLGRPFTGIELRKEQADQNQKKCDEHKLNAKYICDTSVNMSKYIENESMDFIFSCPPYADLEVYSDDPKDLSTMGYDGFFDVYKTILRRTYRKLKQDRFACIVISEVRSKKTGAYISLVPNTINIMKKAGYIYYNEIILLNSVGTLPFRAGNSMNATRKIGRRHQNVLVFYKGNLKNIKTTFSDIMPKNKKYEKEEN